jgi:hypothetical protein
VCEIDRQEKGRREGQEKARKRELTFEISLSPFLL